MKTEYYDEILNTSVYSNIITMIIVNVDSQKRFRDSSETVDCIERQSPKITCSKKKKNKKIVKKNHILHRVTAAERRNKSTQVNRPLRAQSTGVYERRMAGNYSDGSST